MKPIRDMKTSIIYVYERKIMNTISRHITGRYDPSIGTLIEIAIILHDDGGRVVDRHYYKVQEENES